MENNDHEIIHAFSKNEELLDDLFCEELSTPKHGSAAKAETIVIQQSMATILAGETE